MKARWGWVPLSILLIMVLAFPARAASTANQADSLIEALQNWRAVLHYLMFGLVFFAQFLGFIFFIRGGFILFGLSLRTSQFVRNGNPLRSIIFGTVLLNLQTTVQAFSQTTFGQGTRAFLAYDGSGSFEAATVATLMGFAVDLFRVIGIGYMIYGLHEMSRSQQMSQSGMGSGLVHFIGGFFSAHVLYFVMAFAETTGGEFYEDVQNFLG